MCDAFGDVQRMATFCGQLVAEPLAIGRAFTAQIDKAIEHGATNAANEFCLCMGRRLIMQTPQRFSPPIERNAALHKIGGEATGGELLSTPQASKKAALVAHSLRLDFVSAAQR